MAADIVARAATPRKILYLSCHEVLEFDDLRMLTDAGHTVFSLGVFSDPAAPVGKFRTALPTFYPEQDLHGEFVDMGGSVAGKTIPEAFMKNFDVVIVNHYAFWAGANEKIFGDTPVVIRTLGQSRLADERAYARLRGPVSIVRYSEREAEFFSYFKTDEVIYFAKYPSDFEPWTGGQNGLAFHNDYMVRQNISCPSPMQWNNFEPRTLTRLYGNGNEAILRSRGLASDRDMADLYRTATYYMYIYTHPPSYTLSFMEAMLAGCPIIAPSAKLAQETFSYLRYDDGWADGRYEVPAFLDQDRGLVYDTIKEAAFAAHWLDNHAGAGQSLSNKSVAFAREQFGVETISGQWNRLFDAIC